MLLAMVDFGERWRVAPAESQRPSADHARARGGVCVCVCVCVPQEKCATLEGMLRASEAEITQLRQSEHALRSNKDQIAADLRIKVAADI
jgi:hypothetical protein